MNKDLVNLNKIDYYFYVITEIRKNRKIIILPPLLLHYIVIF